ncbi:hypothetical protein [Terrisporobacter sp.]|uniref:hypothetical protein n=1 Tax=Terrisporobacter sp. TaxID=1965305 RepID=UPI0026228521|nr:hypothetical protein [Terrisporobacter sp.]
MFTYIFNKKRFVQKLGNYISHTIVNTFDESEGRKILRSAEELNKLDRLDLAYKFYDSLNMNLEGNPGREFMVDDIAIYIDYMIPKSYVKWYLKEHNKGPKNMKVDLEKYGLIYHYECNK